MPNSLAIFAGLMLLISAVAGLGTSQEVNAPGQETSISAQADSTGNDEVNDTVSTKPRGLNLGLLLFRRG